MSKKPLPQIKRVSRGQRNSTGAYGFDSGCVAFENPLDLIGKKAKQRQKARDDWRATKKEQVSNHKADFHLKHG